MRGRGALQRIAAIKTVLTRGRGDWVRGSRKDSADEVGVSPAPSVVDVYVFVVCDLCDSVMKFSGGLRASHVDP